jgi:hypothetical protein
LKRPSKVTTVLLVTVILPVGFIATQLVVPGNLPDDIALVLNVGVVLVPIAVFLPLFVFVGSLHFVRDTRGQIDRMKTLLFYCPVCDLAVPRSGFRDLRHAKREHFAAIHPEFSHYAKRMDRLLVPYWAGLIILVIMSMVWIFERSYILFLGGFLGFLFLAFIPNRFLQRRVGEFRRRWMEHASGR